jgi:tetratricopeptide (TPR) repeat protein
LETGAATSITYAEKALELAQELQDSKAQADAHLYMAGACSESGDHQRAVAEFQQALAIAESLHDNDRLAKCLHGLGNSHWYLNDFENSIMFNLRLLDVHKRRSDQAGIAPP